MEITGYICIDWTSFYFLFQDFFSRLLLKLIIYCVSDQICDITSYHVYFKTDWIFIMCYNRLNYVLQQPTWHVDLHIAMSVWRMRVGIDLPLWHCPQFLHVHQNWTELTHTEYLGNSEQINLYNSLVTHATELSVDSPGLLAKWSLLFRLQ